jgi:hypothetical protein
MTTDGRIWGWGWNNQGQVGDGTGDGTSNNNRSTPVLLTFSADTNAVSTNTLPVITQQPVSQTVSQGSPAGFSVLASGQAPLSYRWYFNSNQISALENATATNSTLTITNVGATNAGAYHAVVQNLFGSATSSVATLTVSATNGPPVITLQPANQGGFSRDITFTVGVIGAEPFHYQWLLNSNVITLASNSTANSPALFIPSATTNNNGSYQVAITNLFGAVTSAVARLALLPPITLALGETDARLKVRIGSITADATGVVVRVAEGIAANRFVLEFKEALSDAQWKPLATNRNDQLRFIDSSPADRSRFYRVRAE